MPLQRIRTTSAEGLRSLPGALRAAALRVPAGATVLDRCATGATALIAVNGRLKVGTDDDDAVLGPGEGVLLLAGSRYSLRAEEDALALLFELPLTEPEAPGDHARQGEPSDVLPRHAQDLRGPPEAGSG